MSVEDQEVTMSGMASSESSNPVLRNPLMQLTATDFQNRRITPDGLISVIDAIRHVVKECSGDTGK